MPLPESRTSAENGHSGPYRRRCPAAWACQHKKGTQKTSQEHATVVDEDERGHTSEEVSSSSSFSSSSSPAWRKKKPSAADEAQILYVSAVPTANRASISWTSACRLCCLLRSSSFLTWACFCASSSFCAASARDVRKASAAPSTASPADPAREGRARVGMPSHEECRRLRSLLCGPGSARVPGRTPGGGVFCPRRASCVAFTTSSNSALAVFGPRGRRASPPPPCSSGR